MKIPTSKTPARILAAVLLLNLAAAALATWLALAPPWLGLSLVSGEDGGVVAAARQGPSAQVPPGVRPVALAPAAAGPAVALVAEDLLEEPDVVDSYARMDAFFQRQGQIARVLAGGVVRLDWRTEDGTPGHSLIEPGRRPLDTLPAVFWFQLAVSVVGCLIACWVWVLRRNDWGARMFGITGVMFPVFAMPAAVYSSRELALQGDLFQALSALNHFGAFMFGAALVGIFLSYPRLLVKPRHLAWPPLLYLLWWLADTLRIAPDPDWGHRMAVMSEMLLAMALAVVQWFRSRGAPLDRAALRWFTLSVLLGSGLFILSSVTSVSLGWLPPLPQGYAFGFFLLIYAGIALGLRRYRLFDLDEWAYRILLWVGGAVIVVGLDAVLIAGLNVEPASSLGITLLVCGWLYFPARQWLWQRIAHRPRLQLHELMPDVVDIAFKPSRLEQEVQWTALLRKLYDPLDLAVAGAGEGERAVLDEDGLSLKVPSCGGLAARRLRYPDRGGRLFSTKDAAFLDALANLMDRAEAGRGAFEQGADAERKRIARDMHDDVGARLLMLIHRAGSAEVAELARTAMSDLRTVLNTLDHHPVPLADALADWQAEVAQRCDAAGVELDWQVPEDIPEAMLTPRHKAVLERVVREAVSNALKHAGPRTLCLTATIGDAGIELGIEDDGRSAPAAQWQEGRGLRGMRQRVADLGGRLAIETRPLGGHRLAASLPLHFTRAGAAA